MYSAVTQWVSWLPGGLMHSNIGACALFAATSGSSAATAATIGTVAMPQLEKYGYDKRLFLGTLAAGGTLGILIPPSVNMIIFAMLTDTSIPQLYLAGIVPGIILALLFMGIVLVSCAFVPRWGGRRVHTSWRERISRLGDLLPPIGIFVVVVGSIYAGLATPTESAALGVVAALVLAGIRGQLTIAMLKSAFEGTMRTTAMVMLIIMAAFFLNLVLATIGLTAEAHRVRPAFRSDAPGDDSAGDRLLPRPRMLHGDSGDGRSPPSPWSPRSSWRSGTTQSGSASS